MTRWSIAIVVSGKNPASILSLPDLWSRIREEKDPDLVALYHRQLLWPFDRNWASRLGIVVSFILLGYLWGKNVMELTG